MDPYAVDAYAVLGVARTASTSQIRQAYVHLARRTHPDVRGADASADERMRQINAAWEVLSNPDSRAALDRRLARDARRARSNEFGQPHTKQPGPGAASGAHRTGDNFDLSDSDFDDLDFSYSHSDFDGDDSPISPGELPVWMRLGAPAAFIAGVFAVIFGVLTGGFFLVRLGLMSLVFSALLFVLSPFVVLIRSRSELRDR